MGGNTFIPKPIYSASHFWYSSCYYQGRERNICRLRNPFISFPRPTLLPTHSAQRPFSSAMVCTVLARGMANWLSAEAMRQADEATLAYAPLSSEAARVSRWHERGKDTCTTSSWAFDKRHLYVRRAGVSGKRALEGFIGCSCVICQVSVLWRLPIYTLIQSKHPAFAHKFSRARVYSTWQVRLGFGVCYDFCLFTCFAKQMLESGYEGGYQHKASAFWPTFLVHVLTDEQ